MTEESIGHFFFDFRKYEGVDVSTLPSEELDTILEIYNTRIQDLPDKISRTLLEGLVRVIVAYKTYSADSPRAKRLREIFKPSFVFKASDYENLDYKDY